MKAPIRDIFRALGHRPFRIYWIGQFVSVSGTWMQTMALSWLVYRLSDSAFLVGVLSFARFGPSMIGTPLAGVVTDRFSRVRLVLLTQGLAMVVATALAALTLTGVVRVWHLLALAVLQGIVDTLDMPARQTLQIDLVGPEDLQSAVSLNSAAFNAARMLGPTAAGAIVATLGEGVCFAVNAASYAAVLAALWAIRHLLPENQASASSRGGVGRAIREGVTFAWNAPAVRVILLAVVVTSLFGLAYQPILPVLARDVLHSGSRGYGVLLAGAGLGAMLGALGAATRRGERGTGRLVALSQALIGVGLIMVGGSAKLTGATGWMVLIGFALALQLATTNGFLQTTAPEGMRGRLVSLYIWVFMGLAPIGGLGAGYLTEHIGARGTALVAGCACMASAVWVLIEIPEVRRALQQARRQ